MKTCTTYSVMDWLYKRYGVMVRVLLHLDEMNWNRKRICAVNDACQDMSKQEKPSHAVVS